MNVSPGRKALVYLVSDKDDVRAVFEKGKLFFAPLAYASEVLIQDNRDGIADDAVSVVLADAVIYMPFAELVDIAQEIERLEKEEARLKDEIARATGMLGNERFVSKAPEEKIAQERAKVEKYTQMLEQVAARLKQLR